MPPRCQTYFIGAMHATWHRPWTCQGVKCLITSDEPCAGLESSAALCLEVYTDDVLAGALAAKSCYAPDCHAAETNEPSRRCMRSCMIALRTTPKWISPGCALRPDRARETAAGDFRALTTSSRAYPLEHGSLESGVTALTWVGEVQNNGKGRLERLAPPSGAHEGASPKHLARIAGNKQWHRAASDGRQAGHRLTLVMVDPLCTLLRIRNPFLSRHVAPSPWRSSNFAVLQGSC